MDTAENGSAVSANTVESQAPSSNQHAAAGAEQQGAPSVTASNPFVCDICKTSYSRIDHLARHFRRHTKQTSINCPQCSKSFSRPDTLKRHMNTHRFADSPQGKHRQRAVKACFSCAESKLRCEGDNPCRRCQERSLPCRFPQHSRSESRAKRKAPSMNGLLPSAADVVVCLGSTNHEPQATSTTSEGHTEEDNYSLRGLVETMSPVNQPITPTSLQKDSTTEEIILGPNPFELEQPSTGLSADLGCSALPDHNGHGDELGYSWDAFNLDIVNFGALETRSSFAALPDADAASGAYEGLCLSQDAYKQSFLLWTPKEGEHWLSRTADLPPILDDMLSTCVSSNPLQHVPHVRLQESTRYRILSLMLSAAGSADHHSILSCFPSLQVLQHLLSVELAEHSEEADSWFHVPSFDPNTACTELVIGFIISGAFRSDRAIFLRFALALHELHRQLIARLFCDDHRNTRLLDPVQCLVLMIQSGLWSGDSRTIEICESMFGMPITMMRRGGSFRLPYPEGVSPDPKDNDLLLKEKWNAWLDYESRKRLALHLLVLSTQYSMAFLAHPPLAHPEIYTSLPAARAVWNAPSAEAWREAYLNLCPITQLSLRMCIEDINSLSTLGNSVDTRYTTLAVLSGLWLNTWQYKERLKACNIAPGSTQPKHSLSAQILYQEARESLESFATIHKRWLGPMDPSLIVLHERQLMYLHVSLEDLQLLGGKDGESEARRALPLLNEWAESRFCREAMWHAGQILRAARQDGDPTLRVSTIIALYHASLIFWSYSIMPKAQMSTNDRDKDTEIVFDDVYTPLVQQFHVLGFGKPCITREPEGTNSVQPSTVQATQQPEIMMVFRALLCQKYKNDNEDCPSLVGNLTRLIGELGQAAKVVQRWQSLA